MSFGAVRFTKELLTPQYACLYAYGPLAGLLRDPSSYMYIHVVISSLQFYLGTFHHALIFSLVDNFLDSIQSLSLCESWFGTKNNLIFKRSGNNPRLDPIPNGGGIGCSRRTDAKLQLWDSTLPGIDWCW